MSKNKIHSVAIYPPLGIARVGNSSEFFLASDLPGVVPDADGGFKDSDGRIKKQVARFRVYGFNKAGEVVREITAAEEEVQINWRVHVANVKAAWYQFNNALDLGEYALTCERRNGSVKGQDRAQLVIDPGSVSISGIATNKLGKDKKYFLDKGKFFGKEVKLGELRTDDAGRLLFFGGDGHSAYKDLDNPKPAKTFANNDDFHDDISDGIIRATVEIGGNTYEATPAMVAVTPPNYGPGIDAVVTMNDVVEDMFIREMEYPDSAKDKVDFWEHIYPMFQRMTDHQWVNHGFFVLFGKNSPSDFTDPAMIAKLKDNSPANEDFRGNIFKWFRDPNAAVDDYKPSQVPPFYGDGFGEYVSAQLALVDLPITRTQYARLKRWAEGDFVAADCPPEIIPFDKLAPAAQIKALNKAPLEECLGGPFHPGIEITWSLRVKSMWAAPYRLKVVKEGEKTRLDFGSLLAPGFVHHKDGPVSINGPGALTRWLGVPWQTDEASCLSGYDVTTYLSLPSFWAARVPNEILSQKSFERMSDSKTPNLSIAQRLKHFDYRQHWLRDFGSNYQRKINHMIHEWHDLGIIVKQEKEQGKNEEGYLPDEVFVETGRLTPKNDPSFDQVQRAENAKPVKKTRGVTGRTRPGRIFARDER